MPKNQTMTALLEHESFVRSLARSLVGDSALAEDLVQDTWLAALRKPPKAECTQRGWLTRVMQNRLRNIKRGNARRSAREELVARTTIDDRPAALCERLDLQHKVVQAVLDLPETTRDTVLLHFFDDLSPSQIAKRRGEPTATVRSQLKRGLDQVRGQLDREQVGGRRAWCAILVLLGKEETAIPSAGTAAIVRFSLVAGTALALSISWYSSQTTALRESPPTDTSQAAARTETLTAPGPNPITVSTKSTRKPLPTPPDHVLVICKDVNGTAIAEAEVFVFQSSLQANGKGRYRIYGPFESNSQGLAQGPVAMTYNGGKYSRLAYARVAGTMVGFGRSFTGQDGEINPLSITVKLVATRSVNGIVTVPDGFDVKAVQLRVHSICTPGWPETGAFFPRNSTFSGLEQVLPQRFEISPKADGSFQFSDIPIGGRIYLMAEATGLGQAQYANVGRGEILIPDLIHLALAEERVVEGTVKGLPGLSENEARVSIQFRGGKIHVERPFDAETSVHGEFRIAGLPTADEYEISVIARDPMLATRPRLIHFEDGALTQVELRLTPSSRVSGMVVDAETGKSLAEVWVTAIEPHRYGKQPRLDSYRTGKNGRFTLNLAPGHTAIYFAGIPKGYEYPKPQIVKTFELNQTGAPVDGLRFSLRRVSHK